MSGMPQSTRATGMRSVTGRAAVSAAMSFGATDGSRSLAPTSVARQVNERTLDVPVNHTRISPAGAGAWADAPAGAASSAAATRRREERSFMDDGPAREWDANPFKLPSVRPAGHPPAADGASGAVRHPCTDSPHGRVPGRAEGGGSEIGGGMKGPRVVQP